MEITAAAIPELLATELSAGGSRWLLIVWVDSDEPNPQSPTLDGVLEQTAGEWEWTDAGLLVDAATALAVIDRRALNGFDQVAVLPRRPSSALPPCPVIFTSDREVTTGDERELRRWLIEVDAICCAADGFDLRVIHAR